MTLVINVNLQNLEDVKKSIEFNRKNNYNFIIISEDNYLVSSECVAQLIRNGYECYPEFATNKLMFKHRNYCREDITFGDAIECIKDLAEEI